MERMGGNFIGWGGILPDIPQCPPTIHVAHADTVTNARIKRYRCKDTLQVANDFIFPTGDYEVHGIKEKKKRLYDVPSKGKAADPERSLEESKRRAKSKVRDIALCNSFSYMFTWTLDGEIIDRYDPDVIYKKMRGVLSNLTQRKNFLYVCIPEYHTLKDGEEKPAIHFHGLCDLGEVEIVPAIDADGQQRKDNSGRPIYNMADWKLGFSSCVPLDEDYEKAVNYVVKYITKADKKIFGKWYLSSRFIKKAPDVLPIDGGIDFNEFRSEAKLATGEQYEATAYLDVKIVSEEYERDVCDFGRNWDDTRTYQPPAYCPPNNPPTDQEWVQTTIENYPRGNRLKAHIQD